MVANATWTIQLDTDRDSTFDNVIDDITLFVLMAQWQNGMGESYDVVGQPARLVLQLNNAGGEFNMDDSGATYYGKLNRGVFIRLRAYDPATTTTHTMCQLKLHKIDVIPGRFGPRTVTLTAQGPMHNLLDDDYVHELQTDVTADEIFDVMFAAGVVQYPYASDHWVLDVSTLGENTYLFDSSGFTNFDTGNTTFPYVGDNTGGGGSKGAQALIRDVMDVELGRFWWDCRTSKAVFHNRHRDLYNTTIETTITDEYMLPSSQYLIQEDIYNKVTVNYEPRAVGSVGSVLWQASSEYGLSIGQVREFSVRYRDPDHPTAQVGAETTIYPALGTDIVANSQSGGGGDDLSENLGLWADLKGNGGTLKITNSTGRYAYITLCRVRGTPLTRYEVESVTRANAVSIGSYDTRHKVVDLRLCSDQDGQSIAKYLINTFKDSANRYAEISMDAGQTGTLLTQCLARTIGDKITLQDSYTTHDENYVIVGERHQLTGGAMIGNQQQNRLTTTWVLRPTIRYSGWILGIAGNSELGQTTEVTY